MRNRKKLSSAQIRVYDLLRDNPGSFVKRAWGFEAEIIIPYMPRQYAKWNTIYSMVRLGMLVDDRRMGNTYYYKLNPKIKQDDAKRYGNSERGRIKKRKRL